MNKEKTLKGILAGIKTVDDRGEIPIRGIAYDSRRVEKDFLFVALRGLHTDGHAHLAEARARGAAACVVEKEAVASGLGIPCIVVPDTRSALSRLAASFYDAPSDELYAIGVTGTDGKSTTVWFIHQLLELAGFQSGFLSTVSYKAENEVADNPFRQSTPEAPEIQGLLRRMTDSSKEFAVIEATSHGLSAQTGRLADVAFDAAVFTNIAHEHLEFHGSFEQYRDDKANLFRFLQQTHLKKHGREKIAVINRDDPQWEYFASRTTVRTVTFGISNPDAEVRAEAIEPRRSGTLFNVRCGGELIPVRLPLAGLFNVENALAAAALVSTVTGMSLAGIVSLFPSLAAVRGRLEAVECGQPFRVVVDFAHTPQAFGKLLPVMRRETAGRLIVVFGSAGERDTAKRGMQGEAAAASADIIILTDEDPRGEDGMSILKEIAAGMKKKPNERDLLIIPDRKQAIAKAFSLAREGDTVMLLGKGHEKSIIYRDHVLTWNEKRAAEDALREMGYRRTE